MKKLRRFLLLIALLTALICVVLLLNFTAENPTGRRYSSEMPVTTGQGTSQQIGLSGEMILAHDLNLPRNDEPDQLQCICGDPQFSAPNECRICAAYIPLSGAGHRRPDFVSPHFIAESKNTRNLLYTYQDRADQIRDYAIASRVLGVPLWLYTRVDTLLSPEFYQLAESTGGGVVHYFVVPGYVDPVDYGAQIGLAVSTVVIGLALLGEIGARWVRPGVPKAPQPKQTIPVPAVRKVDTAEAFMLNAKERAQRKIDTEDARNHRPK